MVRFLAFALLAATGLMLGLSASSAATPHSSELWHVATVNDPSNGKFTYCAVESSFDNGFSLALARNRDLNTNIVVTFPKPALPDHTKFHMDVVVDGGASHPFVGFSANTTTLVIPLQHDRAVVEALQKGKMLELKGPQDSIKFALDGATDALRQLESCVEKNLKAETASAGGQPEARPRVETGPVAASTVPADESMVEPLPLPGQAPVTPPPARAPLVVADAPKPTIMAQAQPVLAQPVLPQPTPAPAQAAAPAVDEAKMEQDDEIAARAAAARLTAMREKAEADAAAKEEAAKAQAAKDEAAKADAAKAAAEQAAAVQQEQVRQQQAQQEQARLAAAQQAKVLAEQKAEQAAAVQQEQVRQQQAQQEQARQAAEQQAKALAEQKAQQDAAAQQEQARQAAEQQAKALAEQKAQQDAQRQAADDEAAKAALAKLQADQAAAKAKAAQPASAPPAPPPMIAQIERPPVSAQPLAAPSSSGPVASLAGLLRQAGLNAQAVKGKSDTYTFKSGAIAGKAIESPARKPFLDSLLDNVDALEKGCKGPFSSTLGAPLQRGDLTYAEVITKCGGSAGVVLYYEKAGRFGMIAQESTAADREPAALIRQHLEADLASSTNYK